MEIIPFALMLGVMYFMLIRPQVREQQAHQDLLASIAKDDRVATAAGLHGRIVKVLDDTVRLEIAKGTQITIDKVSVQRRVDDAPQK